MQATGSGPETGDWWCVCRRFCRGQRVLLKSKRTWYRHLQQADENEKAAIRTAHLSEAFRVQVPSAEAPNQPSSSLQRLQEEESEPDSDDNDRPAAQRLLGVDRVEPDFDDFEERDRDFTMNDLDDNRPDGPGEPQPEAQAANQAFVPPVVPDIPQPEDPPHLPPNPLVDLDLSELAASTQLEFLQRDLHFIRALRSASLDDGQGITGDDLLRLRNPPKTTPEIHDPVVELALSMFVALEHSSQDSFEQIRRAIEKCFPDSQVPSFHQTKKILADLTGVHTLVDHACVGNCIAFTGPYADLDECPQCGEARYDAIQLAKSDGKDKVPRAVFNTIPIGPQLQALRRHPQLAEDLHYRQERTAEIVRELDRNDGLVNSYDDVLTGSAYLNAVREGRISNEDFLLMFLIDGAQLYESKQSDCWIYIWIILDHRPDQRYKKKYVLPGAIIPGPNKPKYIESFLYPGFHHISALQREGLVVWDASNKQTCRSRLFLFLACGDGPGLLCASNLVGHSGKQGCRMYCPLKGRRKPRASQYYPALLLPDDYDVLGCTHPDIRPFDIVNSVGTSREYVAKLKYLMASPNQRQYEARRLETGIVGPSVLLGLQPRHILGIPECFSSEIMHFAGANMASLFVDLWRGTIDCSQATDSRETWDWAVLKGDTWEQHGRAVAACKPHLPGCFDVAPRNPAEKINSFYKATEFITWLYHLAPALLYGVLPQKYWRNFCKFVAGLRIVSQYRITPDECLRAAELFAEWEEEFEMLYYQRRVDQLQFVRPCVHLANHLAMETARVGAPICSSQWTMERTIGNLSQEMRQPSDPFSNLAQQGIRRCQVNTLKALFPQFDPPENHSPRGSLDIGQGYVLLCKRDKHPIKGSPEERDRIGTYLGKPAPAKFHRWARLRLPNGQIARSAWTESRRSQADDFRASRHVKIFFNGRHRAAEVQYYTQLAVQDVADPDNPEAAQPPAEWRFLNVAYIRLFSDYEPNLSHLSYGTVKFCKPLDAEEAFIFVNVETIHAVIALVPHKVRLPSEIEEDLFFVVDMTGLDAAHIEPQQDDDEGGNNDDNDDDMYID